MIKMLLTGLLIVCTNAAGAQSLYYPPNAGAVWDTVSPQSLGWCTDQIDPLYQYLDRSNTKAFIVLKGGKIVLEKYFGTFTKDSFYYWASAGKTLAAFTVGKAQEDGLLSIKDTTSKYLGSGWTSASAAEENSITIRHQLTMTIGLDDGVPVSNCTLPSCLQRLAAPGTRWAYHNAPYTLLHRVLDSAAGSFITYFNQKLRNPIGMNGIWLYLNTYDHVYFSTPRSAARFGLLMLGKGVWNGTQIMRDTAYMRSMTTTSQPLNLSYGYLWWLAGSASYRLPRTQIQFNGPAMPNAPADMQAALGKNGQIINIVPSKSLVLVRMGEESAAGEVSTQYNDTIWIKLNAVICNNLSVASPTSGTVANLVYPNPADGVLHLALPAGAFVEQVNIYDVVGKAIQSSRGKIVVDVSALPAATYMIRVRLTDGRTPQQLWQKL